MAGRLLEEEKCAIILLLRGPAPSIIAYKDKYMAWLINVVDQVCTAYLPRCFCSTKVVWFLVMIFVILFVFKVGTRRNRYTVFFG
ncbi:hypothetical protein L798_03005 [Zootermopsis nevadensis]|uniref:Uncharacterized protein n=1 Tax=Zootermopsis nevadensis TaxID=136037 RepID=A0A067QGP3_ZOONE|nr:hypothetical protein L798_03005 [Zootermopsis nevadensis]